MRKQRGFNLKIIATLWAALVLVSCGGGGGGTANSGVDNIAPIVDSFGNTLQESSFGNGDSFAQGADGTAGDGAPIANAPVTMTDSAGKGFISFRMVYFRLSCPYHSICDRSNHPYPSTSGFRGL